MKLVQILARLVRKRCQSHDANNLRKTKSDSAGLHLSLLLPRTAATFPFFGGGVVLGLVFFFATCASARRSRSTRRAAGTVTHSCSRARGTSQGDGCPERGLRPRHGSPKPCQKTHPRCQHRSKQPEPASFALNRSDSPLLRCQAARTRQQVKSSALPARSFSLSACRENEEFNRVRSYCLPLDFRLRAGDVFLAVSVKRGLKNGKKMFE